MIRVILPYHLRTLAKIEGEVQLEVKGPVTPRSILDALEARYPMLRGTIRDQVTGKRRPLIRFHACLEDISHQPLDTPLLGGGIGRVVKSRNPKFAEGDLVRHGAGFQERSVSSGRGVQVLKPDPALPLSVYMHALGGKRHGAGGRRSPRSAPPSPRVRLGAPQATAHCNNTKGSVRKIHGGLPFSGCGKHGEWRGDSRRFSRASCRSTQATNGRVQRLRRNFDRGALLVGRSSARFQPYHFLTIMPMMRVNTVAACGKPWAMLRQPI